jgi:hypothetical protein
LSKPPVRLASHSLISCLVPVGMWWLKLVRATGLEFKLEDGTDANGAPRVLRIPNLTCCPSHIANPSVAPVGSYVHTLVAACGQNPPDRTVSCHLITSTWLTTVRLSRELQSIVRTGGTVNGIEIPAAAKYRSGEDTCEVVSNLLYNKLRNGKCVTWGRGDDLTQPSTGSSFIERSDSVANIIEPADSKRPPPPQDPEEAKQYMCMYDRALAVLSPPPPSRQNRLTAALKRLSDAEAAVCGAPPTFLVMRRAMIDVALDTFLAASACVALLYRPQLLGEAPRVDPPDPDHQVTHAASALLDLLGEKRVEQIADDAAASAAAFAATNATAFLPDVFRVHLQTGLSAACKVAVAGARQQATAACNEMVVAEYECALDAFAELAHSPLFAGREGGEFRLEAAKARADRHGWEVTSKSLASALQRTQRVLKLRQVSGVKVCLIGRQPRVPALTRDACSSLD